MSFFQKSENSFSFLRLYFALCIIVLSVGFVFGKTSNVFAAADPLTIEQQKAIAQKAFCTTGGLGTPSPLVLGTGIVFAPPTECPSAVTGEMIKVAKDDVIGPALKLAAVQAVLNFSTFVANRVAYEAAVFIANGGPGQGSMFYKKTSSEAWATLGNDIAGAAVDNVNDFLTKGPGINFNICAPPNPLITLALKLSIKQSYQPQKPVCNFDQMKNNWGKVWADASALLTNKDDALNSFLLQTAQKALAPGSNELSAGISLNFLVANQVQQKKTNLINQQNASKGFTDVTDIITGNVKTPSSVLQQSFQDNLGKIDSQGNKITAGDILSSSGAWTQLAVVATSTFANTLTSQLLNKVYKGLFDTSADPGTVFNVEGLGSASELEASKKQFASVFAPSTIAISDNNVLQEFSSCPSDGSLNRGLEQCVIDSQLAAAFTQASANAGVALTVQQAITSDALHGDWPLISPRSTKNEEINCYTGAYCYGNLVKLRKARAISVGWEMAAASNQNSVNKPITLKEVVAGFYNCNTQGMLDATHPWCHLIDPNWVLKIPDSICRATVTGEIPVSQALPGRQSYCADAPTCIGEDSTGKCVKGYGYCVEEKNVWRIKGDICPQQFATCLSFTNTTTKTQSTFLLNTVDSSICSDTNAGCSWYRTQKHLDDHGTKDPSDDTYEWLPGTSVKDATGALFAGTETYNLAERSSILDFTTSSGTVNPRTPYSYTSTAVSGTPSALKSSVTHSYDVYSYEDQMYLTRNAKSCSEQDAGCTQLDQQNGNVSLNLIQNGSFEKNTFNSQMPDFWAPSDLTNIKPVTVISGNASDGTISIIVPQPERIEQNVSIAPGNFYTLSLFASVPSGATYDAYVDAKVTLLDKNGGSVDLANYSHSNTCKISSSSLVFDDSGTAPTVAVADGWKRFSCTFTVPPGATKAVVSLGSGFSFASAAYDAVQLESGEVAKNFGDGYNVTPVPVYLKLAPAYLGCKGSLTDSAECKNYAQICQAQDVGCNLYTPTNSGPNVPAITSIVDSCPSECVGYDTYRQEPTLYETAKFPLSFIPANAATCSAQAVGCDGFTKLSTVATGGELSSYFTNLRACLTKDMAKGDANTTSATYFTWEGSDNSGFQLQTWQLLQSNLSAKAVTFTKSGFQENKNTPSTLLATAIGPCTKYQVTGSGTSLVCHDDGNDVSAGSTTTHLQAIEDNFLCDEHSDIFTNPDCREFFDSTGNVHYRLFSQTITVDAACTAYRKDTSTVDDCNNSGGYWTDQGFCRYFGLESESKVCSASQNGCREFTGGSGRNATTILSEDFENGISNWQLWTKNQVTPKITQSNDSVSATGHSLLLMGPATQTNNVAFTTVQSYFHANHTDVCDQNGGCVVGSCTIAKGQSSCGPLTTVLARGKVYSLSFWAKGTGVLYAGFADNGGDGKLYDFVDPKNTGNLTPITLDTNWHLYNVGPLDTSDPRFATFDKNSVLIFMNENSKYFNIDNISLIQGQENIDLIKNSWVTPSSCDSTPPDANGNSTSSPQRYLGCKAYTDKKGIAGNYYQFSHVCSEAAVGCSAYYNTYNSTSSYGSVTNARCVNDSANANPSVQGIGDPVGLPTSCIVASINGGKSLCTIAAGQSYCLFNSSVIFTNPLPVGSQFGIVYGPETVITPQDQSIYLVDNGNAVCTEAAKGCQEIGVPTYAQDLKTVTGFTSTYKINAPDEYKNILCEKQALFCDAYSTSQDGNFYFKDPQSKTCEYKDSVIIGQKAFSGWFRTGTSNPCSWTESSKKSPKTGVYDPNVDTADNLIAGSKSDIYRNGDASNYDGWVGVCDATQNRCTELIDVTDTSVENHGKGKSYYEVNNDKLQNTKISDTEACKGNVSQKAGCALFDNTTNTQLKYNASASYMLSIHADDLASLAPNALVGPIDCDASSGDKGVFPLSNEMAVKIGQGKGTSVDLCTRRCQYSIMSGDSLLTPGSKVDTDPTKTDERSCLIDSDCPALTTKLEAVVKGTCINISAPDYRLHNDSNTVLKVDRDRSCSAWLACQSSRESFDTNTNKYVNICDSVNLCTQGDSVGNQTNCSNWSSRPPQIFSDVIYSARDTSWSGKEYSGYTIPDQLPAEQDNQFNINPKYCISGNGNDTNKVCVQDADCQKDSTGKVVDPKASCPDSTPNYRLVHNAGSCTLGAKEVNGADCIVGFCSGSKSPCSPSANECPTSEMCVVGYCQANSGTYCVSNNDCGGITPICDTQQSKCVDQLLTGNVSTLTPCATAAADCNKGGKTGQTCVTATTTANGSCFNGRCLTDFRDHNNDGFADKIDAQKFADPTADVTESSSCRGYPELDSPFTYKVVKTWNLGPSVDTKSKATPFQQMVSDTLGQAALKNKTGYNLKDFLATAWAKPETYVTGYAGSNVCSPDPKTGKVSDNCMCTYEKVTYGTSGVVRYVPHPSESPTSICSTGLKVGSACAVDKDCDVHVSDAQPSATPPVLAVDSHGTCVPFTTQQTMYGWDGYCLERDSTIQLDGTDAGNTKERPCLTWLPVDHLYGATDLYGKDFSAGYENNDTTYYCAETEMAWDVSTSSGYACAESSASCTTSGSPVLSDYTHGGAFDSAYCPTGFFTVMEPCQNSGDFGNGDRCVDTVGTAPDNDFPYFCVPMGSKKLSTQASCDIPEEDPSKTTSPTRFGDVENINSVYYFVHSTAAPSWEAALAFYADCRAQGVKSENLKDYFENNDPSSMNNQPTYKDHAHRDLSFPDTKSYPFCKSLVKVAGSEVLDSNSGSYNAAFTNRVSGGYGLPVKKDVNTGVTYFGNLSYDASTSNQPFGRSFFKGSDPTTQLTPAQVLMCAITDYTAYIPDAGDVCKGLFALSPSSIDQSTRALYGFFVKDNTIKNVTTDTNGQASFTYQKHFVIAGSTGGSKDITSRDLYDTFKVHDLNADGAGACDGATDQGLADCNSNGDVKSLGKCTPSRLCSNGIGTCSGGTDKECQPFMCVSNVCAKTPGFTPNTTNASFEESMTDAQHRLQQVFAESYGLTTYDDGVSTKDGVVTRANARYQAITTGTSPWMWNYRAGNPGNADGTGVVTPIPPTISSVGACVGGSCREKRTNAFSVNSQDQGDILGVGNVHTSVTFFAYADKNQMPLRSIVMDWGDIYTKSFTTANGVQNWPIESGDQTPPQATTDNFYKNNRGLDLNNKEYCGNGTDFGTSPDACRSGYILFQHDYVCTASQVQILKNNSRTCLPSTDKNAFYPCVTDKGECAYRPRVFAMDNWGWCTGSCNVNDASAKGSGCFNGDGTAKNGFKECDPTACPGGSECPGTQLSKKDDPWVKYEGVVRIKPQ